MPIKILKHIAHLYRKLIGHIKTRIYGIANFNKDDAQYQQWVTSTQFTPGDIAAMKEQIRAFSYLPKISVVVPVYNIARQWLERAIDSVREQVYENWELCIADDASPKPHIKQILQRYQKEDNRIDVVYLEINQGMSGSSNQALALATGEYIALLDHDDELSRDSLFEIVKLLNRHPEADLIYSDEDKLTMSGKRLRPVKKSAWDPDLFLTYNYMCHLIVCRRQLILKAGGFRKGFEGSQDYDMLLRVTEQTSHIFHIPKILYHWRMIPGSAAWVVDAKSKSFERAKKALQDAMTRRGINATVSDGDKTGTFKVNMDA
jgi:glycosyltransferase involved in cell wall biosynthesis